MAWPIMKFANVRRDARASQLGGRRALGQSECTGRASAVGRGAAGGAGLQACKRLVICSGLFSPRSTSAAEKPLPEGRLQCSTEALLHPKSRNRQTPEPHSPKLLQTKAFIHQPLQPGLVEDVIRQFFVRKHGKRSPF